MREAPGEWGLCCSEAWKLAAVNSAYFAGAFVGASLGGVLSDVCGRRAATIGAIIINGVALGVSALASGPWQYAVARCIAGGDTHHSKTRFAYTFRGLWSACTRTSELLSLFF